MRLLAGTLGPNRLGRLHMPLAKLWLCQRYPNPADLDNMNQQPVAGQGPSQSSLAAPLSSGPGRPGRVPVWASGDMGWYVRRGAPPGPAELGETGKAGCPSFRGGRPRANGLVVP